MLHRSTIVALGILAFSAASAQSYSLRKGDKAYKEFAYSEAIARYEEAVKMGADTGAFITRLADSYLNVRDFANAAKWYKYANTSRVARPIDMYNYAQCLRATGQWEEADKWMSAYARTSVQDGRPSRQMGSVGYVKALLATPMKGCIITNIAANCEKADMGAVPFADRIVFASARRVRSAERRLHDWNGEPFLDLFSGKVGPNGELSDVQLLPDLNTRYHESNAAFTPDGKEIWFTRNNFSGGVKGRTRDGVVNLKIYSRQYSNGAWVNEQPFPFNSDAYSVGHPCLSQDGNTMYFSSDMPGGTGGTDIWRTVRTGATWSKPVCLGNEVNTEGKEMFPFIGADGTFAFSSDGHQGLGGLDILVGRMGGDGTVRGVKNPGAPLNSDHDDLALMLDPSMRKGYFTSDRPGGKGDDDIYAFILDRPLGNSLRVQGRAIDRHTRSPVPGVTVELKDSSGKVIASTVAGADGGYMFEIGAETTYLLDGSRTGYRTQHADLWSGPDKDTIFDRDLLMAKYADVTAWVHVVNARTGAPLDDVTVRAIDVPGGNVDVINGLTNTTGDLRSALKDRALGDSLVFRVRLTRQGFFPKKGLFLYAVDDNGEVAMHQLMDLAMDPIEVGVEVGTAINTNPIYFDLGKWNIRPDAAIELDKVVAVMNENPTMAIELGSHTDSRGSASANLSLSDKRAKSSAAYIVSKGIARDRIKAKGYGESKLLNKCGNNVKCNEQEHQLNRRTEFIITKM